MDRWVRRRITYYTIDKNAEGEWILSWEGSPPGRPFLSAPRYLLQGVALIRGWHPLRDCDAPTTRDLSMLGR